MPESVNYLPDCDKGDDFVRPMRLAYLLIDGFALMSYAPVVEPFRAANRLSGSELYTWRHYSVTGAPAKASNGLVISVDETITAMEPADILFVCAGGNPALFNDSRTFDALRRAARFGTIIGGVSGGPYVLARAGLLDGFRCTIHWEHIESFEETFAEARLESGLFVIDRARVTCAGGLAGLDLSVALIARDHGVSLANKVSDWYIHGEQRQASWPQRQSAAQRYGVSHSGLLKVLKAMEEHIAPPLTREDLAEIANLSVRQLERLFKSQMGSTISEYYLFLRLEKARKLLSETAIPVIEASIACGFSSVSHFSRSFKRQMGASPSEFGLGPISHAGRIKIPRPR